MNIFCTDRCPETSARTSADKLVVKMPTESAQLFATCFSLDRLAADDCPRTKTGRARRHFNPNHPCGKWVRESWGNFEWLLEHSFALIDEKHCRYPNGGEHFALKFIEWCRDNKQDANISSQKQTEFPCCINASSICRTKVPDFENIDRVEQYRYFIKYDKAHYNSWIRNRPAWIDNLKY